MGGIVGREEGKEEGAKKGGGVDERRGGRREE